MARPCLSLYIDARGRTVLHRAGFSWLALLAVPLWALQRKAWDLLLLSVPLGLVVHGTAILCWQLLPAGAWQGGVDWAWTIATSWVCGRWANEVHRRWLLWRGHVLTATEVPALWPSPPDAADRTLP